MILIFKYVHIQGERFKKMRSVIIHIYTYIYIGTHTHLLIGWFGGQFEGEQCGALDLHMI